MSDDDSIVVVEPQPSPMISGTVLPAARAYDEEVKEFMAMIAGVPEWETALPLADQAELQTMEDIYEFGGETDYRAFKAMLGKNICKTYIDVILRIVLFVRYLEDSLGISMEDEEEEREERSWKRIKTRIRITSYNRTVKKMIKSERDRFTTILNQESEFACGRNCQERRTSHPVGRQPYQNPCDNDRVR
jgi:hypothetical protein